MEEPKGESSSVTSTITNIILWMFVPSAITNFLLKQYYSNFYAKNSPSIPKPNSMKHKRNYKLCYTVVIGIYFLYCIGQTIYSLEESYYSKIGVNRGCSRSEFKKNSRKLLLSNHPDKSSGNVEKYHELKKVVDVLENPNLCNIYEKFGKSGIETVLQASTKKNYINDNEVRKDYIIATLFEWLTFYIGSFVVLLFVGFRQKSDSGRYWRFVALILLGAYESFLYLNDFTVFESIFADSQLNFGQPLSIITYLLSRVPIFQRIQVLRQLFVFSGLAMSQLGPLWFPSKPDLFNDKKALIQELETIQKGPLSEIYEESKYVFNSAFEPFEDNEEMKNLLKRQMGQIVVDLKVLETMTADLTAETRKNR